MICAARKERNLKKLDDEVKSLLVNEKGYKMDKRQTKIYKELKVILETRGCEIISKVYVNARTKLVFKCITDDTHKIQATIARTLRQKSEKRETCCSTCNLSLGTKRYQKRKMKSQIKDGKNFKKMKVEELGEEGAKQSYIDFLASDKTVAEKKKLIVYLNTTKGNNRLFICIETDCMLISGYGYKDIPIHCYKHKLSDEKIIAKYPCPDDDCTIAGTIDIDGIKYCLKHAVKRGYIAPKKWYDGLTYGVIMEARQMKYGINPSSWVGQETEEYLFELLQSRINDANIEWTGYLSNSLADLEISFNGDSISYGIQIRTIGSRTGLLRFPCKRVDRSINKHTTCKYPDEMLIIATNPERSLFVCVYSKEVEGVDFSLTKENLFKFKDRIFNNVDNFVSCVYNLSRNSLIINDDLRLRGKSSDLEYKMMQRLKNMCESKKLSFEFNTNYASPIDCIINGNTIQCKFSSSGQEEHTFAVRASSKLLLKTGKKICVPYHLDDDIDAFIVQIESKNNKNKYESDFLIIPKTALISLDIIQTSTQYGKTTINIPSPDYAKPKTHPLYEFWNRFDILETKGNGINEEKVKQKQQLARKLYQMFKEEKRMNEIEKTNKSLLKLEKFINKGKLKYLQEYFEKLFDYLKLYGYRMHQRTEYADKLYYEIYKPAVGGKRRYLSRRKKKEKSLLIAQKQLITEVLRESVIPSEFINKIVKYYLFTNKLIKLIE